MNIGWPQGILLFLAIISLSEKVYKHGQEREPYHGGIGVLDFLFLIGLLWWGGFFNG